MPEKLKLGIDSVGIDVIVGAADGGGFDIPAAAEPTAPQELRGNAE